MELKRHQAEHFCSSVYFWNGGRTWRKAGGVSLIGWSEVLLCNHSGMSLGIALISNVSLAAFTKPDDLPLPRACEFLDAYLSGFSCSCPFYTRAGILAGSCAVLRGRATSWHVSGFLGSEHRFPIPAPDLGLSPVNVERIPRRAGF
jgi:hypothetical protein